MEPETFIAVASVVTVLATLVKQQGDNRKDSSSEWQGIANSYKNDLTALKDEFYQFKQEVEETNSQHEIERNEWKKEQQKLIEENASLTERISILEETLTHEGVDVHNL